MIKAFVDSSVLYASIISSSGASREILKRNNKGEIQLVITKYVVDETRDNLTAKNPDKAAALELLIDLVSFEFVDVSRKSVQDAVAYTEIKDAPVVAAAIAANCEYLLTFDKQHLLGNQRVAEKSGLTIATPGDLMQRLRTIK
ncbi:MAG: PIN domain-containing protein [Chloroflexi bacterium]|nr:MAG: hypothetical protein CUN54_08445 [Phototrophicales bacterium]RMF78437.1 MAG: PIN domain-containing protein [Chloroflexota bacterium]